MFLKKVFNFSGDSSGSSSNLKTNEEKPVSDEGAPCTSDEAESAPLSEEGSESAAVCDELDRVRAELSLAQSKLAETHDRMLRVAADFENSRKRWERERQEVRQYSVTEFARDLLPVIDAFDKAIAAVENSNVNPETEDGRRFAAVVEGIQLVSKVFYESVKKHGIERLPGKGEPFNPTYHNAVAKVVDANIEQDIVTDEFVAGYKIGERVLRTAMVRVTVRD